MSFSRQVLTGLGLGILVGLFLGEAAAPLALVANGFVRLLQMTVLPYVTVSIAANLGALTYAQARALLIGAGSVLLAIWATALGFTFLFPLALPDIDSASFYSPALGAGEDAFNFLDLYVPANPFNALANNVVPAVVLFSVMIGLALIGVEKKAPLLDVLHTAGAAIARIARFIVRLTPVGIFAIAANAAGTLDVDQLHRIEVYLVAYVAFALILALWVLPGLIGVLTPVRGLQALAESRDALLTAFLVGDLFIVLPALIEACSTLIERHIDPSPQVADLPRSIIPTAFTFPHAGKLLSISFILFAGWFSDAEVPVTRYPQLAASGFFSLFGSMNAAVPFLLDLFRIPADTFQLFLATGVINSRFGTLLAGVHTVAVGLLGSAAIAGRLHVQPRRLFRFAAATAVLTAAVIIGLRTGFATFLDVNIDGRVAAERHPADRLGAGGRAGDAPAGGHPRRHPRAGPCARADLCPPGPARRPDRGRHPVRLPQRSRPDCRLRRRDGAAAGRRSRRRRGVRPLRAGRARRPGPGPQRRHRDERRPAHPGTGRAVRLLGSLPRGDAGDRGPRPRSGALPVMERDPRPRADHARRAGPAVLRRR